MSILQGDPNFVLVSVDTSNLMNPKRISACFPISFSTFDHILLGSLETRRLVHIRRYICA